MHLIPVLGFLEKDGKPYCRRDFYHLFAPKCSGCGEPVSGNYLTAVNGTWHPECFVCAVSFLTQTTHTQFWFALTQEYIREIPTHLLYLQHFDRADENLMPDEYAAVETMQMNQGNHIPQCGYLLHSPRMLHLLKNASICSCTPALQSYEQLLNITFPQ